MQSDHINPTSEETIGQRLSGFYREQGIPADGGMSDRWVRLRFGSVSIPFPNTQARKDAVKYHDIHHILTGYPTSWRGEAALGAYEVAAGCGSYKIAWVFNMGIFALGLFIFPLVVFRAFIRGKRAGNFYHAQLGYDQILMLKADEAKTLLQLDMDTAPASVKETFVFLGWWLFSFIVSFLIYIAPMAYLTHLIID